LRGLGMDEFETRHEGVNWIHLAQKSPAARFCNKKICNEFSFSTEAYQEESCAVAYKKVKVSRNRLSWPKVFRVG
jgi:hypothetical protein